MCWWSSISCVLLVVPVLCLQTSGMKWTLPCSQLAGVGGLKKLGERVWSFYLNWINSSLISKTLHILGVWENLTNFRWGRARETNNDMKGTHCNYQGLQGRADWNSFVPKLLKKYFIKVLFVCHLKIKQLVGWLKMKDICPISFPQLFRCQRQYFQLFLLVPVRIRLHVSN